MVGWSRNENTIAVDLGAILAGGGRFRPGWPRSGGHCLSEWVPLHPSLIHLRWGDGLGCPSSHPNYRDTDQRITTGGVRLAARSYRLQASARMIARPVPQPLSPGLGTPLIPVRVVVSSLHASASDEVAGSWRVDPNYSPDGFTPQPVDPSLYAFTPFTVTSGCTFPNRQTRSYAQPQSEPPRSRRPSESTREVLSPRQRRVRGRDPGGRRGVPAADKRQRQRDRLPCGTVGNRSACAEP